MNRFPEEVIHKLYFKNREKEFSLTKSGKRNVRALELECYYCEQRKERFEQGTKLKHIHFRETLYPLFVKFLVLDRFFRKQKIVVLGGHKKDKGQVIYACTHIGENDLENIYESLHRGCFLKIIVII